MKQRLFLLFVCALVAASCIGYLVYSALHGHRAPAHEAHANVVIATENLAPGALIGKSDVKIAAWPGPLPAGAIAKIDLALNRGVVSPIYEGEPIVANRLADPGSGGGLAALIPPGRRACAVRVDEVVGVAGFVTPGMRVDVLMTGMPPNDGSAGPRVRTLMQNIQVLSAGVNLQKDSQDKPQAVQVVNLLVTPDQAETLSLATNQNHIQLVLRNPVDHSLAMPRGAAMAELFGVPARSVAFAAPNAADGPRRNANIAAPPPPAAVPPAKPAESTLNPPAYRVIEVFNGASRSETRLDMPVAQQ